MDIMHTNGEVPEAVQLVIAATDGPPFVPVATGLQYSTAMAAMW